MRRRARVQRLGFALLTAAAALALLPLALLLLWLVLRAGSALTWAFLTQPPADGMRSGGIFPALVGSLLLALGALAVALPLGFGAAIYLAELAPPGPWVRLVRLATLALAGVPSVVYGLFGLALFGIVLGFGPSLLTGCLTLGLLVLPVVMATAEEALRAVPQTYREASRALGAAEWQTVRAVVLPQALPGFLTAAILAVARAAGETAPILFTAVAFYMPHLPRGPLDRVMALPYHLYAVATQVPGVAPARQYATAVVLLGLVLCLSAAAMALRAGLRRGHHRR